jgi:hypothetical protein
MSGLSGFHLIVLTGFMFLASAGCDHMPVASMVKLARIDFQSTDPEKLRVAVKLPQALKARADGTLLRLTVKLAGDEEEARDFALADVTDMERAALASEAQAGTELFAFALARTDIAQLRLFRAALMGKQKAGAGGSLTISVRPDACRAAPLPDGPVWFSTYLKTAETNGYVPLARDVDLRKLDPNQDIAAKVPACR